MIWQEISVRPYHLHVVILLVHIGHVVLGGRPGRHRSPRHRLPKCVSEVVEEEGEVEVEEEDEEEEEEEEEEGEGEGEEEEEEEEL